jgi:hypothetical protein
MVSPDELDDLWLHDIHRWLYPSARVPSWKAWATWVRGVEVELRPGGRASLRHPDKACTVEIVWALDGAGTMLLGSAVHPDEGIVAEWSGVDLGAYEAAFHMAIMRRFREMGPFESLDPFEGDVELPAAGKPPPIAFYKHLLDEYEQLLAEGKQAPVKELARRYKRPEGTVKSWLSRGRKHLGRETR